MAGIHVTVRCDDDEVEMPVPSWLEVDQGVGVVLRPADDVAAVGQGAGHRSGGLATLTRHDHENGHRTPSLLPEDRFPYGSLTGSLPGPYLHRRPWIRATLLTGHVGGEEDVTWITVGADGM